jgi:GTP diphosphokinase / guanosine-3',5'-bis(diphosphate) 3'-diphosphatase
VWRFAGVGYDGMVMTPTGQLLNALAFAADKHRDQRRKDVAASPYINHPIALARVLSLEGAIEDVDVLCAALLHDTIEDTETTAQELRSEFGERIAGIVEEVTDDKTLTRNERKERQIQHASHLSVEARAVKLADKICNLRDVASRPPADWDLSRQQEYFEWAKRVIDGLRGKHPQLEALFDRVYTSRPG